MRAVAGVFASTESAARAAERLSVLLGRRRVMLLTPDTSHAVERVPVTEDMPPVGGPMIGIIAGAVVMAIGLVYWRNAGYAWSALLAAAVAAALAGAAGWALGRFADRRSYRGLPVDELFVYQDVLRQGRHVIVALVRTPDQADHARQIFHEAGAESVDHAREQWWLGLRDAEEAEYEAGGERFRHNEALFRQGFEAALLPAVAGKAYAQAQPTLIRRYPSVWHEPAFERGFQRGCLYRERLASAPHDHPVAS